MKRNGAFVVFLIILVLLMVFGLFVLFTGIDSYRNRTLIEERPLGQSVVSYLVPRVGRWNV